jgi:hypothetical protein
MGQAREPLGDEDDVHGLGPQRLLLRRNDYADAAGASSKKKPRLRSRG